MQGGWERTQTQVFGWSPSSAHCQQSCVEKGALRFLQGWFNCGISFLFSQEEEEDVTAFVLSPDDEVGLCWGLSAAWDSLSQEQGGFWGVCAGQELDPWSLWVPSIRTFHDPMVEQPEPHPRQCIPQPAQHISQPIPKPSSGCLPAGVPRGAGGLLLHRAHGSFPVFQQDPGAGKGHYIVKQLRD